MSILKESADYGIDAINNPELISYIKPFIEKNDHMAVPGNMLFSGPAGSGKTSSAINIAKAYLGNSFEINFREFNSSDDRGIEFVQTTLKDIAKSNTFTNRKVILLDECDGLTPQAQNALRRTLEIYDCIFILTCNYVHKLIEPLVSRCIHFKFKGFPKDELLNIGHRFIEDRSRIESLADTCSGDIRKFLNGIQKVRVGNDASVDQESSESDFIKLSTREFCEVAFRVDPDIIIRDLHNHIISVGNGAALVELSELDYRCSQGTYKPLQLQAGFIKIKKILDAKK